MFAGSEEYPGGPFGMGVRVPMIVISPWSKGGYVNSQVFDHTSIIRLIERRFGAHKSGLEETQITPWRRAVAGDLTSAFNFATPNDAVVAMPSTLAYLPPDNKRHPDYVPVPPEVQAMPVQEKGVRPARALPYELQVQAEVEQTKRVIGLRLINSGSVAAVFQVRAGAGSAAPWTYTVGAREEITDSLAVAAGYDLSVYGANGFFRCFKGSLAGKADLETDLAYDVERNGVMLKIHNKGAGVCPVSVLDGYSKKRVLESVRPGKVWTMYFPLAKTYGWYDLMVESSLDASFQRHLAGHVETGRESMTDPAIGA
jgi:phospholipase C